MGFTRQVFPSCPKRGKLISYREREVVSVKRGNSWTLVPISTQLGVASQVKSTKYVSHTIFKAQSESASLDKRRRFDSRDSGRLPACGTVAPLGAIGGALGGEGGGGAIRGDLA
jgi:hypothetical protein